jgi:hypothetical protein
VAERLLEGNLLPNSLSNMAADVVAIEELPDGRRLVVFSDRREIVVGVARPRAHPVPGVDWLWARPPSSPRARPRHTTAPGSRRPIRILADERDSIVSRTRSARRVTRAAEQRADELLCSLLDPLQRADWDVNAAFWVETPRGPVRLGHLYSLIHRPHDRLDQELILCVVPHAHHELPIADIWSNLLLVLAVEPEEFFRVAIQRGSRRRAPDSPGR